MAEYTTVARLSEIEEGHTQVVEVNGTRLALCHVAGGSVYVIDDRCTHDGAPLDQGELDGYAIECPRHGARFDVRDGHVIALPALVPVDTYEVIVDGDDIKVRVG